MKQRALFRTIILLCLATANILPLRAATLPTDTLLQRLYEQASTLIAEGVYDSAQHCLDRAFAVRQVEQSPVYPVLLNEQGTLLTYIGEYERAIAIKKKALLYLSGTENLETRIGANGDLGVLYRRYNRKDSALYYYQQALQAAHEYGDPEWLAYLSLNMSVFYFNQKRWEEAESYIEQALEQTLKTDDRYVTMCIYQVRGSVKAEMDKLEECGLSTRKAWQLATEEGNPEWQLRCLPSLYRYFSWKEQTDSIDHYLRQGEVLSRQLPPNSISVLAFIETRAKANFQRQHYAEALRDYSWLRKADNGTENNSLYEMLARCYHHLGQERQAFLHMDSARIWTDSLARQRLTSKMAEFNVKYQTQEQELKINQLKQSLLEKETATLKVGIALILLLAACIIGLLFFRHKQRLVRHQMKQLEKEKELESTRRYLEGLEEECKHFAKELHDGIANDLLGLQLQIETRKGIENQQALVALVKGLRSNVRSISHELMPPEFERLTLDEILHHYAETLEKNTDISVCYASNLDNGAEQILPQTAYELYRIVQELTANIVKHSDADRIEISLVRETDDTYKLQLTDNGKRKNPEEAGNHRPGIGLRTVADRVRSIGGDAHTENRPEGNCFILKFKK